MSILGADTEINFTGAKVFNYKGHKEVLVPCCCNARPQNVGKINYVLLPVYHFPTERLQSLLVVPIKWEQSWF